VFVFQFTVVHIFNSTRTGTITHHRQKEFVKVIPKLMGQSRKLFNHLQSVSCNKVSVSTFNIISKWHHKKQLSSSQCHEEQLLLKIFII